MIERPTAIRSFLGPIALLVGALSLFQTAPSSSLISSATTPATARGSDWLGKLNESVEYVVLNDQTKPPVRATSFLLLDQTSNDVLVSRQSDLSLPVASTTKMVTALVARSIFDLEKVITVPRSATLVPGSKINLLAGEKITVHNLLRALLIQSANDAAFTLAQAKSDNPDQFVNKMNEFVRANRLIKTTFNDPAGLDDEVGRSSAFELSQIARLVLQDPILAPIVATGGTSIASVNGNLVHPLTNSNRLVLADSPYFLPLAIGIKTGFTNAAGHCLVAAYKIKDRVVIGVVLSTSESTIEASAKEMRRLFLWAESRLEVRAY
ncbi:MAG: hypothetical protein AAB499_02430 [Patescibacteria group bacterium]